MLRSNLIQPLRGIKRRLSGRLSEYLEMVSEKPAPSLLERATLRAYHGAHIAAELARHHEGGHAELWCGMTAGGQTLRVAYVCDGLAERVHTAAYLRHLLFSGESITCQQRGAVPVLKMRRISRQVAREADLVIVERNALLHWRPRDGISQIVPAWIHMLIDLSPGRCWQQVEQAMHMHANNIRRVHRQGFTYQFSTEPADFDLFYDHMLLPTSRARFHEYAEMKTREELGWFFAHGGLLLVRDAAGAPVAGGLVLLRQRRCYAIAAGVLEGSDALYKQGAMSAVYYFRTRWCYENGITSLDAGGCRALASDGIYTYKRMWGFQPVPDRWNTREWLFWAPAGAAAALQWLAEHPPVELPFL